MNKWTHTSGYETLVILSFILAPECCPSNCFMLVGQGGEWISPMQIACGYARFRTKDDPKVFPGTDTATAYHE